MDLWRNGYERERKGKMVRGGRKNGDWIACVMCISNVKTTSRTHVGKL